DKHPYSPGRMTAGSAAAPRTSLLPLAPADGEPADWHRWTTNKGFALGGGWHYVAVTYTFGKSSSICGFIDGQAVPGAWDMGGATDRAPAADADDLTLGSRSGRRARDAFSP